MMKKIEKTIPIQLEEIYNNTSIFISAEVSVEKGSLMKLNIVNVEDDILYHATEEPIDLKVTNKGSKLRGKKLVITSRYNVIAPTEGEPIFPKVTWKPNLEAGDHTLYDDAQEESSDDNMFEFRLIFEIK